MSERAGLAGFSILSVFFFLEPGKRSEDYKKKKWGLWIGEPHSYKIFYI